MAKYLPINVKKIVTSKLVSRSMNFSDKEEVISYEYLITLEENKSNWQKTLICNREQLLNFRDEINKILGDASTAETLNTTEEIAKQIDEAYKSDILCRNCSLKMTKNCIECITEMQSPLERRLFVALKENKIYFSAQLGINKFDGSKMYIKNKSYDDYKKEILTKVDFYIEEKRGKLCVYADGHTYHNLDQKQVSKDRNQDFELQNFGYTVLRFTTKDINENMETVINKIEKWISIQKY